MIKRYKTIVICRRSKDLSISFCEICLMVIVELSEESSEAEQIKDALLRDESFMQMFSRYECDTDTGKKFDWLEFCRGGYYFVTSKELIVKGI